MPEENAPTRAPEESAKKEQGLEAPVPAGAACPTRLPCGRAIIPIAGIALAVWVCLGSAWRWDVTPKLLVDSRPPAGHRAWAGRYVRLRAGGVVEIGREDATTGFLAVADPDDPNVKILVKIDGPMRADAAGVFCGRVVVVSFGQGENGKRRELVVDATRGRLDSRGVIGLLVGVWGAALLYFNMRTRRRARRLAEQIASRNQ